MKGGVNNMVEEKQEKVSRTVDYKGKLIGIHFTSIDSRGRPVVRGMMLRGALLICDGKEYITLSDYVEEFAEPRKRFVKRKGMEGGYLPEHFDEELVEPKEYTIIYEQRWNPGFRFATKPISGHICSPVKDESKIRFLLEAYYGGSISPSLEEGIQAHMAFVKGQEERESSSRTLERRTGIL